MIYFADTKNFPYHQKLLVNKSFLICKILHSNIPNISQDSMVSNCRNNGLISNNKLLDTGRRLTPGRRAQIDIQDISCTDINLRPVPMEIGISKFSPNATTQKLVGILRSFISNTKADRENTQISQIKNITTDLVDLFHYLGDISCVRLAHTNIFHKDYTSTKKRQIIMKGTKNIFKIICCHHVLPQILGIQVFIYISKGDLQCEKLIIRSVQNPVVDFNYLLL